jgi:hypothetical protein
MISALSTGADLPTRAARGDALRASSDASVINLVED